MVAAASAYTGGGSVGTGTLLNLLKEQYTPETVAIMAYKDHPFWAMLSKDTTLGGEDFVQPVIHQHPRRSATFATAQTLRGSTGSKRFKVTTVDDYSTAEINRKTRKMIRAGNTAFIDSTKLAIDQAIRVVSRGLSQGVFGEKLGKIGTIGAIGSDVVTLTDPNDIVNFELDQLVDILTGAAGAVRAGGPATIIAIDRDAGTFTMDLTVGSAAPADGIITSGDYNLRISGLQSWIPATAPTVGGGDSHFSVDRAADPVRLAGTRVSLSGYPVHEGLLRLLTFVCRNGGNPDVIVLNDARWLDLAVSLGSKVVYDVAKSENGLVGFDAIVIAGPKGKVKVVADSDCPYAYCYALQMDTWTFRSVGLAPEIFDMDDDQMLLRLASSDAYELRVGYYGQLSCSAPGWNGVGIF